MCTFFNEYVTASNQNTQEVGNPEVRQHLIFYPDAGGKRYSGPWHAARWCYEVPSDLAGPMVRVHTVADGFQDFYVDEPCLIQSSENDVILVIPIRWFTCQSRLFGRFHRLKVENAAYQICEDHIDASINELLLSFPLFLQSHHHYNLPRPTLVKGKVSSISLNITTLAFRVQHGCTWECMEGSGTGKDVPRTSCLVVLRRHIRERVKKMECT